MRSGIRARMTVMAGQARGGLLAMAPNALLILLCTSALAPLIPLGGAVAVGGVVGSVGANLLSELISRSLDALRRRSDVRQPSLDDVERELSLRITRVLDRQDADANELRAEMALLLERADAASVAMETLIDHADLETQVHVARTMTRLGQEFTVFAGLIAGIGERAADIQAMLHRQEAEHRHDRDRIREQSMQLTLLREELSVIEQRTRRPGEHAEGRSWPGGCPYRGLSAFDERDLNVFYGREHATARLLSRLSERLTGLGMLVVTGASGSGKSSLLRAGLMPALARGLLPGAPDSRRWPRLFMTPTRAPLHELAGHLAAHAGLDPLAVSGALAQDPDRAHMIVQHLLLTEAARHESEDRARPPRPERLVLVVDQFEEIFTLAPAEEGAAFARALLAVAGGGFAGARREPNALVILGIRGDFLHRCAADPGLALALEEGQFVVGPMSRADLRLAITGPASVAGLTLASGLADHILDELGAPILGADTDAGTLPLLSQAMLLTWENREKEQLTLRGYERFGGVSAAVGTGAEAAYSTLSASEAAAARRMFQHLIVVSRDGHLARRRLALDDLPIGDHTAVLDTFARRRLLVLQDRSVEIAHDVLLHTWPRLHGWIEDLRASLILHTRLLDDAQSWDAHGRDPSFLYRGTRLASVRQVRPLWEADHDRYPALTRTCEEFLEAAERASSRSARRRRAMVGALAGLLVVAVAAAGVAVNLATAATSQSRIALSRQLAAQSESQNRVDPTTAQLLAVAAWRVWPTPDARHSLLAVLASAGRGAISSYGGVNPLRHLGPTAPAMAFSPDGKVLASADDNGTFRLWDPATRRQVGDPLAGHTDHVRHLAFSPDGQILASSSEDGTVRLWTTSTRRPLGRALTRHTGGPLAFSPDGRLLVTGDQLDATLQLWDVGTRRPAGTVRTNMDKHLQSLAFSPDGSAILAVGDSRTARLWEVGGPQQASRPLTEPQLAVTQALMSPEGRAVAVLTRDGAVRLVDRVTRRSLGRNLSTAGAVTMAFSPGGAVLALADAAGSIRLWDTAAHAPIGHPLPGLVGGVSSLSFSPDGTTLASAAIDGSIHLWDTSVHRSLGQPLRGHSREITGSAVAPDGRTLATASTDGSVRLWDLPARRSLGAPLDRGTWFTHVTFSPSGEILAVAEIDGSVKLWRVAGRRLLGRLTAGNEGLADMTFSPDGRLLVTASRQGEIFLWNASTLRRLGPAFPGGPGTEVAFSPDGSLLAVATADTVRLWNADGRTPVGRALKARGTVRALAFGPDGGTLVTGGDRGELLLWNTADQSLLGQPLAGHTETVRAVAFSSANVLVTGSDDTTARLWEVSSRRQIGEPFTGHTGAVTGVAFAPGGNLLVTASFDRTARLWKVPLPNDPLAAVCGIARRSLTVEEWRLHLPGESYQRVCP